MGSITCEPKVLADVLAAVKPAVWTKSAVNAHAGVRITSNANGVTLTASNFDLFIRRALPVLGEVGNAVVEIGELDVCVNHAELVKVSKAFAKHDAVTLELHKTDLGEKLDCYAGGRTINLPLLRLQDVYEFPNLGGNTILEDVNGEYLAGAVERVAKFASKDDTRPVLTGIYLDRDEANGELTLVATDSYRLCARTLRGLPAWAGGYNIPAKGLVAAAKLMHKEPAVTVRAHHSHAILLWPGTEIAIRLIDGQYPNYRQLMPDTWPSEVKIPVGELRAGADLGVQFLTKNAPIRFYVNGVVKLSGNTPDGPSFEEILPGASATLGPVKNDEPSPTEFECGWNPEFLRDIAQSIEGETAVVNLISPLRPALIHGDDDSERHLLMPIRLNV